ncbi:MAG: efflux RND transporter permease subunit, partial [Pseudomonadota bacterium]
MSNNTAPGDPPPLDPTPDVVSEAAPARDRKGVIPFMARNGVAANLLMIFLLLAGIYAYGEIVQEVFPESSLDTVQVSVDYPGATPDEIEQSIISSVEEAVEAV